MMLDLVKVLLKICSDIACLLIFGIPLWVYNLLNVPPVSRSGFFCNDDSIRYPYRNNTVSSTMNFLTGFMMTIVMVSIIEAWLYIKYRAPSQNSVFNSFLVELYRAVGYYTIGAAINQFLTDLCKWSIGTLRPHFFELCQPNVTCTPENEHVYIDDYVCLRTSHPLISANKLAERLDNARKSFPSGHASFSFYSCVFIVFYIEYRLCSRQTRLFRHLVQAGIVAWALWTCGTRIYDFKHRYSDVAAGMLLGGAIAACLCYAYVQSHQSTMRNQKCTNTETGVACCYQRCRQLNDILPNNHNTVVSMTENTNQSDSV